MSTKLNILNVDTICKGKFHSWEYMRPYIYIWYFFQITLMRSNSEAGTTLDRINWDFGVANEIFMDNEPNQNDYNTENIDSGNAGKNGRLHYLATLSTEK